MSRREQRPRVGFNLVRGLRGPVTANAAAIGATVPVALDSRTSIDTPGTETPSCPPDVQAESSGIQDDSNGMLLNLGANAAQGMIHPVMGGLAFGAQFAPVPLLPAAIRVIDDIITAFENVKTHRDSMKALCERARKLQNVLQHVDASKESALEKAIQDLTGTLESIKQKANGWAGYGYFKTFVLQYDFASEIAQCKAQVDDKTKFFELHMQVSINTGVHQVLENQKSDAERRKEEFEKLQGEMTVMQQTLKEYNSNVQKHKDFAQRLYNVQMKHKILLPNVELEAGEVQKIGLAPIGGASEFDFYEGLYLSTEKVLLKIIRTRNFTDKHRKRFTREAKIWRDTFQIDKGEHFVPLYGVCYFEGMGPCLVSPFYKNGDVLTYFRNCGDVNRIAIIRFIAEGLNLLHTQTPPVAHGELKAAKIMITDEGTPLIADFGLSKIIEDATGAPFTRTQVSADQYRWFAPEVCSETFVVTTKSDVFSFGMVILEIMTEAIPFAYIRRATEIVPRVLRGERPKRPEDPEVEKRGLDDKLWDLMQRCWSEKADDRPTMAEILEELPVTVP